MGIKSEAVGRYFAMGKELNELATDIKNNANDFLILYKHDIKTEDMVELANEIREKAYRLDYIVKRIAGRIATYIFINGDSYEVLHENPKGCAEISYSEVFSLAYPGQPERTCSVTYRKGRDDKSGILSQGQSIELVDHMIFNIAETGNA